MKMSEYMGAVKASNEEFLVYLMATNECLGGHWPDDRIDEYDAPLLRADLHRRYDNDPKQDFALGACESMLTSIPCDVSVSEAQDYVDNILAHLKKGKAGIIKDEVLLSKALDKAQMEHFFNDNKMSDELLQHKLYDAYQLDWMLAHGYSLSDLIKAVDASEAFRDSNTSNRNLLDIYEDWAFEKGFGTEIWATYDEFINNDFLDKEYINGLIQNMPYDVQNELREAYSGYMKKEEQEKTELREELSDNKDKNSAFTLTNSGLDKVYDYIKALNTKRQEIIKNGLDTLEGDNTKIPGVSDIINDIQTFYDAESKEYCNGWGVTDEYNSDYPLQLDLGKDFVKTQVLEVNRMGEDLDDDVWITFKQGNRIGTMTVLADTLDSQKKNRFGDNAEAENISDIEAVTKIMKFGGLGHIPDLKSLPLIDEQSHALQTVFRLTTGDSDGPVHIDEKNCDEFFFDAMGESPYPERSIEAIEDELRNDVCYYPELDEVIHFSSEEQIRNGAAPIVISSEFPTYFAMRDKSVREMIDIVEKSLQESADMTLEEAIEKRGLAKEDFMEALKNTAKSKEVRLGEMPIAGAVKISTQQDRVKAVYTFRKWMKKPGRQIAKEIGQMKRRNEAQR